MKRGKGLCGARFQTPSALESWRKVKEAGSPQKIVKVVLPGRCQVDTEATPQKET